MAKRKTPRTIETVITHLEMTRPPSHYAPAPAGIKLAFMRAEACTVSFYRYLYAAVGEKWLWWERRAVDDDTLAEIIQDERIEIFVLYAGGVPAGYAEIDRRQAPTVDLAYFGLIPEFIGRGLGPYMLGWVIDAAWTGENVERLTVNTCNLDHPKAVGVYQRAGFAPVRQERRTVDDPRDTGLIPPDTPLPPGAHAAPPSGPPKGGAKPRPVPGGRDA